MFKFELFFVFPFGTIPYRKADYFSAHGIGGRSGQGGCGKYALQRNRRGRFSGSKRERSLAGTIADQSNFAEKITGLTE